MINSWDEYMAPQPGDLPPTQGQPMPGFGSQMSQSVMNGIKAHYGMGDQQPNIAPLMSQPNTTSWGDFIPNTRQSGGSSGLISGAGKELPAILALLG
jgi:hypothetical protein